jgi:CHAD domain-containing protein
MRPASILERLLARRHEALAAHLTEALGGDAHAVHQARVASRRLREVLPVVAASLSPARRKRWRRRLRRLTRTLGPVRERDVALAMLDELPSAAPSQAPAFARMRTAVAEERRVARAALTARYDPARVRRLLEKLERLQSQLPAAGAGDIWRRELARRLRSRARALQAAVADAGALFVPERLHGVRIATKKLRYGLELAGEARLAPTARLVRELKAAQESLGRLHDLDVLRATAARLAAALPPDDPNRTALAAAIDTLTAEMRELHARYLKRQAALVRVADRTLDDIVLRAATEIRLAV